MTLKEQMGLGPALERFLLGTQLEPSPRRPEKEARMSQEGRWVGLQEERGVLTRALESTPKYSKCLCICYFTDFAKGPSIVCITMTLMKLRHQLREVK